MTLRITMTTFWRNYLLIGSLTLFVIMIDSTWMLFYSYSFKPKIPGVVIAAGQMALLGMLIAAVTLIPRYAQKTRSLRYTEIAEFCAWGSLILIYAPAFSVLSYISVAHNAPLIDKLLLTLDHSLGFDWKSFADFVAAEMFLKNILRFSYNLFLFQLIAITFLLCLLRLRDAVCDLHLLLFISAVPVAIISALFPASSLFLQFPQQYTIELQTVSQFYPIRTGALRIIDLDQLQGLVSMPSFHAASGVYFVYVARNIPFAFPVLSVINGLMLLSTPTEGGHYLVDVIAGLLMAVICIYVLRCVKTGLQSFSYGRVLR